jgi:prepilin-type N-terminal cleavage/methylation domain-containing protein/prepilin-type processing-associated H-X9-DG protein
MNTLRSCPSRRGFTLIEMLVVIAILGILIAIILPGISRAREQAMKTRCSAHLKQIGIGAKQYLMDHKNVYPPVPGAQWDHYGLVADYYRPYLEDSYDVFRCPAQLEDLRKPNANIEFPSKPGFWPTYEFSGLFTADASGLGRSATAKHIPNPTIAAYAWDYPYNPAPAYEYKYMLPHSGGMNVLYADSHVAWLAAEEYNLETAGQEFYMRGLGAR